MDIIPLRFLRGYTTYVPAKLVKHSEEMTKDEDIMFSYKDSVRHASGKFGTVYVAHDCSTGGEFAIKKIIHKEAPKECSELRILREMDHTNIVKLKCYFRSPVAKAFLCLGMEFMPFTLRDLRRRRFQKNQERPFPPLELKLYAYQVFRGIAHIHAKGYFHCDLTTMNILVDTAFYHVKICDFGSAKKIPPETDSNFVPVTEDSTVLMEKTWGIDVDISSIGWIIAELLNGHSMVKDVKIEEWMLGVDGSLECNNDENGSKLRDIQLNIWNQVFGKANHEEKEFVYKIFSCIIDELTALDYIASDYFEDIRAKGFWLNPRREMPPLFNFTKEELGLKPELNSLIIPKWMN